MCLVNDGNNSNRQESMIVKQTGTGRNSFLADRSTKLSISSNSSAGTAAIVQDLQQMLYLMELEFDDPSRDSSSSELSSTELDGKNTFIHPKIVLGFKASEDQENWCKACSIACTSKKEEQEENNGQVVPAKFTRVSGPMTMAAKKFLWQLLYMVPDDLELQHRYICSLAKVDDDRGDDQSNSLRDSNTGPTSIRIIVNSARGLPVKESKLKNVKGSGKLQSTVFVELQMKQSLNIIAKFRTNGQPKAQNPTFRETFEFHNIEFTDTTYIQIDVKVKNSALSLGDPESKVGVITLKLTTLLSPAYSASSGVKEWFTLSNPKTGAPIAAGDAALQLSIFVS